MDPCIMQTVQTTLTYSWWLFCVHLIVLTEALLRWFHGACLVVMFFESEMWERSFHEENCTTPSSWAMRSSLCWTSCL